jgi:hypothetical protein
MPGMAQNNITKSNDATQPCAKTSCFMNRNNTDKKALKSSIDFPDLLQIHCTSADWKYSMSIGSPNQRTRATRVSRRNNKTIFTEKIHDAR